MQLLMLHRFTCQGSLYIIIWYRCWEVLLNTCLLATNYRTILSTAGEEGRLYFWTILNCYCMLWSTLYHFDYLTENREPGLPAQMYSSLHRKLQREHVPNNLDKREKVQQNNSVSVLSSFSNLKHLLKNWSKYK